VAQLQQKFGTTWGGSQIPLPIRWQMDSIPLPTPVSFAGMARITDRLHLIFPGDPRPFWGSNQKSPDGSGNYGFRSPVTGGKRAAAAGGAPRGGCAAACPAGTSPPC
jgi:hypothetical protein